MRCQLLIILYALFIHGIGLRAQNVKVEMHTSHGNIVCELYTDKAPTTCANFLKYIEHNKFEGAHFYRVVRMDNQPNNDIKIEVIQGGLGFDVEESAYAPIKHETTEQSGILHKDGTLSMARADTGTATSEFFICIGDQPSLDFGGMRNPDGQGFAAFGQVVEGMEVVRNIQKMKDEGQMLLDSVAILSITIIK